VQPEFVSIVEVALMGIMAGSAWGVRTKTMARAVLWIAKRASKPLRRRIWRLYRDIQGSIGLLLSSPRGMARVLYAIVPALFLGLGITVDWPIIIAKRLIHL
jgi:hypothetical protein